MVMQLRENADIKRKLIQGGKNGIRHWSFGCGSFGVCDYVFSRPNIRKEGGNGLRHWNFGCGYFSVCDYVFSKPNIR